MKKILIVNSNYYKDVSKNLEKSSFEILRRNKILTSIITVPGIFEIPIAIRKYIKNYDGFIALGCVIKGKTPHFDLICDSTFNAIINLSIFYNKPISNGIITAINKKQAYERSGIIKSNKPNKGLEAANAVLSILYNGPKKK